MKKRITGRVVEIDLPRCLHGNGSTARILLDDDGIGELDRSLVMGKPVAIEVEVPDTMTVCGVEFTAVSSGHWSSVVSVYRFELYSSPGGWVCHVYDDRCGKLLSEGGTNLSKRDALIKALDQVRDAANAEFVKTVELRAKFDL
jgi:hypothetical protein